MDILGLLGLKKQKETERTEAQKEETLRIEEILKKTQPKKINKDYVQLGIREAEQNNVKDKDIKNFKMRPYDEHYRRTEGDID